MGYASKDFYEPHYFLKVSVQPYPESRPRSGDVTSQETLQVPTKATAFCKKREITT